MQLLGKFPWEYLTLQNHWMGGMVYPDHKFAMKKIFLNHSHELVLQWFCFGELLPPCVLPLTSHPGNKWAISQPFVFLCQHYPQTVSASSCAQYERGLEKHSLKHNHKSHFDSQNAKSHTADHCNGLLSVPNLCSGFAVLANLQMNFL